MYEIKALIYQDLKLLFKNKMWIFYNTAFPFLLLLIMGNLASNVYGDVITSYDYYTITTLVYCAINAAVIASNSFMEERLKAGNMRILYAPMKHNWLYLSKIIASTIFTFICHIIMGIIAVLLLHIHIGNHILLLLILLCISELCSCTLGILFCLRFQSESMANQILSIFINISALLGGVFFSLDRFGGVFSMLSWLSPMKWLLHASFTLIYDDTFVSIYFMILMLSVLTGILLFICSKVFKEERCICSSY